MDPIKQASDALYEATKAKVLQDMEDQKKIIYRLELIREELSIVRRIKGVDAFMKDTFIQGEGPIIPIEKMMELYKKWYETEGQHLCKVLHLAPTLPFAYSYIRDHGWVSRTEAGDFTNLVEKSTLTVLQVIDYTTPTQQVEIKSRPKGKPKTVKA
jgi:hypothetical protein